MFSEYGGKDADRSKVDHIIIVCIYFPNLRLGFKASRFFSSVLYFWGPFVEFLIFISTNLRDEKTLRNLF